MKKDLLERFWNLYDGLDRAHGIYNIDPDLAEKKEKGEKITGAPQTIQEKVEMDHWDKHVHGKQGLGIVPIRDDQCCVFAALDIDEYNLDLKALNQKVHNMKLPFVTCRTKSGGAHLYVFFSEPVKADLVRKQLEEFGKALGYPAVEIFPKQKVLRSDDIGNWINMPYYDCAKADGSVKAHSRYGYAEDGKALPSLEAFLDYAENHKISGKDFAKIKVVEADVPVKDGPACLQTLFMKAPVTQGGRNNVLTTTAVYLKEKYGDGEWEEKLDDFNFKYFDPPVKSSEVQGIIKSVNKGKTFYLCEHEPLKTHCAKPTCLGRRFGVGNTGGEHSGQLESLLQGVKKTVTYDDAGKVVDDLTNWIVTVDGEELSLTTDEFWSQDRLIKRLMERFQQVPIQVKPQRWQFLRKEVAENAHVIVKNLEESGYYEIWEALKEFCTKHGEGDTKVEVDVGKVWRDDVNRLYFRSHFFFDYLSRKGLIKPGQDKRRVMQVLRDHFGVETSVQLMIDPAKNINRTCMRVRDWEQVDLDQTPETKPAPREF